MVCVCIDQTYKTQQDKCSNCQPPCEIPFHKSNYQTDWNQDIERGDHGELTVLDKKYKYDINLEEDGTFVIWWRMSVAKAFLSTRHYPIYKNSIAAMGIIAYEVQQVFPVVEEA